MKNGFLIFGSGLLPSLDGVIVDVEGHHVSV
jgi:hypothetical protein